MKTASIHMLPSPLLCLSRRLLSLVVRPSLNATHTGCLAVLASTTSHTKYAWMSRSIDLSGHTTRFPPLRLFLAQNRTISGKFRHFSSTSPTLPGVGATLALAWPGAVDLLKPSSDLVSLASVPRIISGVGGRASDITFSSSSKHLDTRFTMIAIWRREKDPRPNEMPPFAMELSLS